MIYKNFIRPVLFNLDAEEAHDLAHNFAINIGENEFILNSIGSILNQKTPELNQTILGLEFNNPVGLAAGFDKNGRILDLTHALGFGFTEIGSITAESSVGNAKPRLFRLPADYGLINRMGLNNDGAEKIISRLKSCKIPPFPLGINIAKTHNPRIIGDAAIRDYAYSFNLVQEIADYITINVSCPNTEEGKTFEDPVALEELLSELFRQRDEKAKKPILVKLSADLTESDLEVLVSICEKYQVDGYVATNTSSKRELLSQSNFEFVDNIGRGGLSGRPLKSKSTRIVRGIAQLTGRKKPIIAVGGIDSAETAIEMFKSGAWLLQVYTGLIYEGIGLPAKIKKGISAYMKNRRLTDITQIRQID